MPPSGATRTFQPNRSAIARRRASAADRPDSKVLPLLFTARMLRESGSRSVGLVAPYLCYLRQYSVPTRVAHAAPLVADWIRARVERPILIGPDLESRQWVSEVAESIGAPVVVLEKVRRGDRDKYRREGALLFPRRKPTPPPIVPAVDVSKTDGEIS